MKAARRRAAHTRAAGLVLAASMMIFSATSSPAMMRTSPVGRSSAVTVAASLRPSPVVWSQEPTWLGPLRHYSLKPTPLTPEQQWLATRAAACILYNESRDGDHGLEPNVWQFEDGTFYVMTGLTGDPGSYPRATQDDAAWALYNYDIRVWGNGWHAWSTRFICGLGG